MKIVEQNEGKKINYVVNDTTIIFDDALSLNIAKYQKDEENTIDICLDNDMQLKMGLGMYYVANIVIPPRTYKTVDTNTKNDKENEIYQKTANLLNIDDVTLVLWTLPYGYGLGDDN